MARPARQWSVPALAVAGVTAFALAPHAAASSGRPALPARSAAALIASVERSDVTALSGTVRTVANLGLPQIPDSMGATGAGWQALLTGTHQLRVWVDGPRRQRVALLDDLAETDVVHDARNGWVWSSTNQTAHHVVLPARGSRRPADGPPAGMYQLTPQAQAKRMLRAVDPTTRVTVDPTVRVAGRPAYQLDLVPRTTATLVRSVRIAVDAATGLPLRVQVFAAGSAAPAFETGYTSLSLRRPAASVFAFSPAPGTRVRTTVVSGHARPAAGAAAGLQPKVSGRGWTAVLQLNAGARPAGAALRRLDQLTTAVPQGRLLKTRLVTVLLTNDGRLLLGAVPASTLEHAAGA
jgi:hypothetical protein